MTETAPRPRHGELPEATLQRLRRVLNLSLALNAVADIDHLLGTVLRTVTTALDCEQAALLLYDDASASLRFAAATGDQRAALARVRVPLTGSLAGTAFRENRVVLAADAAADERHFGRAAAAASVEVRVLLAVPMRTDGRPIGVLEAINPRGGSPGTSQAASFDAADVETLLVVSAQAAVAVRNATQRAALEDANRRLEALDRVRADFVTVASHELRTPLAAVQGYAQTLADEVEPAQREAVAEVLGAARRMAEIVETLDELGSLQGGAGPIETAPVALHDVVTGVPDASTACPGPDPGAAGRRTVDVRLPDRPVVVDGDARRLRLAFGHLLANADAFTPADGQIWIEAEEGDGSVTVRVRDTGTGIAAADLERIFEPFVQADPPDTRPHEGLGVGLALARSVVLRHGGRVWATSAGPGQGSTFHVRLPVRAA